MATLMVTVSLPKGKLSQSRPRVVGVLEWIVAAAIVVFSTQSIYPIFLSRDQASAGEQSFEMLVWLFLYGAAAVLAFLAILVRRQRYEVAIGLIVLAVLALVSITWSIAPEVSWRRAAALAGTLGAGVWIVNALGVRKALQLVRVILLALLALSLLAIIVFPDLARDPLLESFRGIFYQKNNFARIAIFALLFELIAILWLKSRWWMHALAAGVALACLWFADSTTALLLGLGVLPVAAVILFRPQWWRWLLGALGLGVALAVTAFVTGLVTPVLDLLGKDPTLSHRTSLWAHLIEDWLQRPIGGWGFGAYWSADPRSPQTSIQAAFGYDFVHAHNGYLDVLVQLGIVGMVVMLVIVVGYIVVAGRGIAAGANKAPLLSAIAIIVVICAYNVTESPLVLQNSFFTLLLASAVTAIVHTDRSDEDSV